MVTASAVWAAIITTIKAVMSFTFVSPKATVEIDFIGFSFWDSPAPVILRLWVEATDKLHRPGDQNGQRGGYAADSRSAVVTVGGFEMRPISFQVRGLGGVPIGSASRPFQPVIGRPENPDARVPACLGRDFFLGVRAGSAVGCGASHELRGLAARDTSRAHSSPAPAVAHRNMFHKRYFLHQERITRNNMRQQYFLYTIYWLVKL